MNPKIIPLHRRILSLARTHHYEEIRALPEAQVRNSIAKFSDNFITRHEGWFLKLEELDRAQFVKGMAIVEDQVGGLMSVSVLQHLLPLLDEMYRDTLDWVLRNTCAYEWFARGNTSIEEFERHQHDWEQARAKKAEKEIRRQAVAKAKKAVKATKNLPNAVRRGDIKAVKALLAKGADPMNCVLHGEPLNEAALKMDRQDIANALNANRSED